MISNKFLIMLQRLSFDIVGVNQLRCTTSLLSTEQKRGRFIAAVDGENFDI